MAECFPFSAGEKCVPELDGTGVRESDEVIRYVFRRRKIQPGAPSLPAQVSRGGLAERGRARLWLDAQERQHAGSANGEHRSGNQQVRQHGHQVVEGKGQREPPREDPPFSGGVGGAPSLTHPPDVPEQRAQISYDDSGA